MKKYIFVHNNETIDDAILSYGDSEPGHDSVYDACKEVSTDWFDTNEPFTVQEYINGNWEICLSGHFKDAEEAAYGEDLVFQQFGVKRA
jgi:hypothetical protein